MSQVRRVNTIPELRVRQALYSAGFRYRLDAAALPGRPDIVLAGLRVAIFVHGCFWHRHRCAAGKSFPKTQRVYWLAKFEANRRRDRAATRALRRLGWRPIVLWECQIENEDKLAVLLRTALGFVRTRRGEIKRLEQHGTTFRLREPPDGSPPSPTVKTE
jgi:DNA mismatch endonuclease (patch repair protein)